MIPGNYDLSLYRGDTARGQVKLWADVDKTQPMDLTGAIAQATIRDKAISGKYQMLATCTITPPNIIDLMIPAAVAETLPATGVWDLQVTYPSGDVRSVLKGKVSVTQDVTYVSSVTTNKFAVAR